MPDPDNDSPRLLRAAALRGDVNAAWADDAPLKQVLERCARAVVDRLGALVTRVWTTEASDELLVLEAEVVAEGHGARPLMVVHSTALGRVVVERAPLVIRDLEHDERVVSSHWVRTARVHGFVAYPLLVAGRAVGVLGVTTLEPLEPETLEAVATAAELIGSGIERRRALLALRRSEERLRTLVDASAVLGSSLDYEQTLRSVARLVVPKIADWCSIHLTEGESQLPRELVTAHKDPDKVEWARELGRRYPPDPSEEHGAFAVIRTGQPELYPDIPEEMLVAAARDEEHLRLIREVGFRSAMVVPLTARGRTFGAITFVAAESGRHYDEHDLAMARELAERAAYAVDNARLYRDAQEAIRLRDDFLSIASHELKTPLTPLHLHLESIRRLSQTGDGPGGEQVLKRLDTIIRQVGRLETLVNGLLEIGRIAGGRFVLEPEDVDAAELVREVVARFSESSRQAHSELRLHSDETLPGRIDRMRFEQIVANLLSNALKFGEGHPVDVSLRQEEGWLRLTVRDQGIGVSREDQARIFGRFERAVPSRHYGGFGLGLWIVKQLVDAMGGRIRVDSEPGQGAVFTVELPLGQPAEAAPSTH